ncbi:NERD domain-containing protein [Endozoicomonas gorgoniicola]|uniref:NERD domain-containing protein n=1 Tax=Endozoicomonas gorgoniicola TaxID=1234144 RepID=A0ABT3MUH5_9GAMM|nr:NERD domain-containing protein [Endozoicomonas gorgoniicola]MCW7553009.1 NERD domain-containing protein [Endozoicomonas gorgoniicola]
MIDFTQIIMNVIPTFWYIIPLLILVRLFKSPWFKGILGEATVNLAIKIKLDKRKYYLIKNITLPTEDGSTQIDHILVSENGIFVIETKNMNGWIFGSEKQKQWTQKIFKHTSKFQNPLHQNYKHAKTLASCLAISDSKIFSVIVFVGNSEFKTEMPENVTYAGGLIRYIKSRNEIIFSTTEKEALIKKIESGRLKPSPKTNREHVQHVREIKAKKESEKSCPKCGSAMIQRVSKKGANAGNKFWGCSQFPKCRAICT